MTGTDAGGTAGRPAGQWRSAGVTPPSPHCGSGSDDLGSVAAAPNPEVTKAVGARGSGCRALHQARPLGLHADPEVNPGTAGGGRPSGGGQQLDGKGQCGPSHTALHVASLGLLRLAGRGGGRSAFVHTPPHFTDRRPCDWSATPRPGGWIREGTADPPCVTQGPLHGVASFFTMTLSHQGKVSLHSINSKKNKKQGSKWYIFLTFHKKKKKRCQYTKCGI